MHTQILTRSFFNVYVRHTDSVIVVSSVELCGDSEEVPLIITKVEDQT